VSEKKRKSLWGLGVAAINIGFVLFILALVMYASVQDRQLVEESYYEHGLVYQDRIDRMKRSDALNPGLKIEHQYGQQQVLLSFPKPDSTTDISGTIRLIRPSNSRLDRTAEVTIDADGLQFVSTTGMAKGLWRINVDWVMDSIGYYNESRIVIP